ncbi:hypothetical protein M0R89_11615 [Halorussus limi]|uniref:Uncharacterized protein n=1 Tax=Halorussus limi TaxID=2938695 RepID=A0A8U0HQ64_9EURY|nr:hypothetical protein [Halorussus limi]UPV73195.1 hypothetical protein M0R89_11615 [Halorussus limi]
MPNDIDLASEDLQVLHVIHDADHAVTTTTVREQMHWADDSAQIRYRLDKLEDRGLVETWHDDERAEPHQMPPRVAETTDAGDAIADDHDDDRETLPVEERMARIEQQLDRMRDTYGTVKQRIVELEEEVEDHDEDLDDLAEDIRALRRYVE